MVITWQLLFSCKMLLFYRLGIRWTTCVSGLPLDDFKNVSIFSRFETIGKFCYNNMRHIAMKIRGKTIWPLFCLNISGFGTKLSSNKNENFEDGILWNRNTNLAWKHSEPRLNNGLAKFLHSFILYLYLWTCTRYISCFTLSKPGKL